MSIPEGFTLVPVEPTAEMNKEGMRWLTGFQHMRANDKRNALSESFKAMLAAAPIPPQPIYDESKELELFMSEYPLPSGCQWSEEHQNFGWVKKSAFQRLITYRALWTGWKACAQSRAKSLEVGDE